MKPRASHRAGPERKPQSRSEKYLQECRDICQHSTGTVPGVLRWASGQREKAGDGASHPGTENRRDHFDHLEERSVLRRKRITSASSLSVSGRELVPSSWVVVGSVLETLGSRGVSDRWSDPVCFGTESLFCTLCPLGEPEIAIGPEPRIEPWLPRNRIACQVSRAGGRCHYSKMNRGNGRAFQRRTSRAIESHQQIVGWISRQKISRLPAEGEPFLLTSPFIEPAISKRDR